MTAAIAAAAFFVGSSTAIEPEKQVDPMWFKPPLQAGVNHRPGDVIISVPGKSGTTWTMNIFYQLREGGDPNFRDIYEEVPWVEFKERPDQTDEELYARWDAMPTDVTRGFKTHDAPGSPFFQEVRDDMKYVVVVRNPEEAIVSFLPFLKGHRDELWDHWNAAGMKAAFGVDDPDITFAKWFDEVVLTFSPVPGVEIPGGMLTVFFFNFINGWWSKRHNDNVLMLHYNEMKSDHEGSIRKIGAFLGGDFNDHTEAEWNDIFTYTSYKWMKANGDKFEVRHTADMPIMKPGNMVRKGAAGKAHEDGMTPEIAARIKQFAEQIVPDPAAREWLFKGGPLTPASKDEL